MSKASERESEKLGNALSPYNQYESYIRLISINHILFEFKLSNFTWGYNQDISQTHDKAPFANAVYENLFPRKSMNV